MLIFKDRKLLFVDGKLAMSTNCCCNQSVCGCIGSAPSILYLAVSDITGVDCTDHNTTFALDYVGAGGLGGCAYTWTDGIYYINVEVYQDGANTKAYFDIGLHCTGAFTATLGASPLDCSTLYYNTITGLSSSECGCGGVSLTLSA